MSETHLVGTLSGRGLYVVAPADVDGIDALPNPFVAFTAIDGATMTDPQLRAMIRALVQGGCCYSCSWGPDCRRVHDTFDEVASDLGLDRDEAGSLWVTTWHERESLEEALWFALYCAGTPWAGAPPLLASGMRRLAPRDRNPPERPNTFQRRCHVI